jgi:S-methylmethionine-dependent homocysteine/selenocysteine methylase
LDCATGTELERRGLATRLPLWTADAALRAPTLLRQVHQDALEAGAHIITANTFRTNPYTLRKAGREADAAALTQASVQAARDACQRAQRGLVAGSIAPLEDCYQPESVPPPAVTRREHALHVRNLVDAGVDLLLVESMNTAREAHAAAEVALESALPVWVSMILAPGGNGDPLSGEDLEVAFAGLRALEVRGRRIGAFLVNCAPVATVQAALARLGAPGDDRPIGAYPNAGWPDSAVRWIADGTTPRVFAAWARSAAAQGARIVGGCCGTGPEHLRAGVAAITSHA